MPRKERFAKRGLDRRGSQAAARAQARGSASPDPSRGLLLRRCGLRSQRERSGRRLRYPSTRQCCGVVCDQTVDPKSKQRTGARRLVHRPGHDDVRYFAQSSDGLSIGKAFVDRNPLERVISEATKRQTELSRAADGVHATHRCVGEGLEQSPPAGGDGEASLRQVGRERMDDALGESLPWALQIEQELRLGGRGGKQLFQTKLRAPRRLKPPPIPENRDRPGRLQVPDLEPASIEADVSFYKGRLEALCGAKVREAIPGAVCDEERARPVVAQARQGWPPHRRRV
jgi:hypothetical protein